MESPLPTPAEEAAKSREPLTIFGETSEGESCWVCSQATVEIHCKIICPNCGFTRDCTDP